MRTKVADLTTAVTNGYNAMAKQLLHSESSLRHLEQRINVLNKLENSYNVHLKMKEGTTTESSSSSSKSETNEKDYTIESAEVY